ncbi:MAG: hypothetical protein ACKOQ2_03895, partial [Dolichospermum sp.]
LPLSYTRKIIISYFFLFGYGLDKGSIFSFISGVNGNRYLCFPGTETHFALASIFSGDKVSACQQHDILCC